MIKEKFLNNSSENRLKFVKQVFSSIDDFENKAKEAVKASLAGSHYSLRTAPFYKSILGSAYDELRKDQKTWGQWKDAIEKIIKETQTGEKSKEKDDRKADTDFKATKTIIKKAEKWWQNDQARGGSDPND